MKLDSLNLACADVLKHKNRVIIAFSGLKGSGKSTLAKSIRKEGFGDFKPYEIAVIDDDVMSINLFLIRPKVRIKREKVDDLKPFFKFIPPFVKLIFYVNTDPTLRLSYADVLLVLHVSKERQLSQLYKREETVHGVDENRIKSFLSQELPDFSNFEYSIRIDL